MSSNKKDRRPCLESGNRFDLISKVLVITDKQQDFYQSHLESMNMNWNYMGLSNSSDLITSYLAMCIPSVVILDSHLEDDRRLQIISEILRRLRNENQLLIMVVNNNHSQPFIKKLLDTGVSEITTRCDSGNIEFFIHRVNKCIDMVSEFSQLYKNNRRIMVAQELANIGSWEWLLLEEKMSWSESVYLLLGFEPFSKPSTVTTIINSLVPNDRKRVKEIFSQSMSKIKAFRIECQVLLPSDETRNIIIVSKPIFNKGDFECFDGYIQDITEQKINEHRINELAFFDPLTGLDNRRLLVNKLKSTIEISKRNNKTFSVLFLDLDNFQQINDSFGHEYGDLLLQKIASRLMSVIRAEDTVSRIDGDEFCVLLSENSNNYSAVHVAQKILQSFTYAFDVENTSILVSSSIGISEYPENGLSQEMLFKTADTAMHNAKSNGKNQFSLYSEELTLLAKNRLDLEQAILLAFQNKEFFLYYQPKASLAKKEIMGVEALLRWDRQGYGFISPEEFIPVAESMGLIIQIGNWVLESACRQLEKWHASGIKISMAVNVSPLQFETTDFIETVRDILNETKIAPDYLELEITESGMQVSTNVINSLKKLRAMGVKIAIDDFGTGYSTLSSLKKLPVDTLKIDKEFIQNIPFDSKDSAMVASIVGMAKTWGLNVVAEGVEKIEQVEYLYAIGCDIAQGYYISRPKPCIEVEDIIRNNILQTSTVCDVCSPPNIVLQ